MAADMKTRLTHVWQARNPRERMILTAGGVFVLCAAAYAGLYLPLETTHRKLAERLPQMRAQQRLMSAQVEEIERLRRDGGGRPEAPVSLARRIQSSLMTAGLQEAVVSVTPVGEDLVQVVTRERPVNDWMAWLFELQRQGVRVKTANLRYSGKEGAARLEVSFTGSTS